LKHVYFISEHSFKHALGDQEELMPARKMNFVGNGDFKKTGDEFLTHFVNIVGLRTTDKVLDVGCGIGRMAIPLAKYIDTGT